MRTVWTILRAVWCYIAHTGWACYCGGRPRHCERCDAHNPSLAGRACWRRRLRAAGKL